MPALDGVAQRGIHHPLLLQDGETAEAGGGDVDGVHAAAAARHVANEDLGGLEGGEERGDGGLGGGHGGRFRVLRGAVGDGAGGRFRPGGVGGGAGCGGEREGGGVGEEATRRQRELVALDEAVALETWSSAG